MNTPKTKDYCSAMACAREHGFDPINSSDDDWYDREKIALDWLIDNKKIKLQYHDFEHGLTVVNNQI